MEIQIKLTMFIPKDFGFYIYPFPEFLPDLKAKFDSKEVPILSYNELSTILNRKIEPDMLTEILRKKFYLPAGKIFNTIAVIKIPEHDDGYKEIIIKWKESLESYRKKSGLTLSIPFYRQFNPGLENASMYVSIAVDEKFELTKPRVTRRDSEIYHYTIGDHSYVTDKELINNFEYDIILADKRRYVFRIPRNFFDVIKVDIEIKIPITVRLWIYLGIIFGIAIEVALLLFGASYWKELSPFVAGTIAGLIALRFVLFHDIELLKLWNYVFIVLIGGVIVTLIIQMFMSFK